VTTDIVERIELPDGTFMDGPLLGVQEPRFFVEPDRHREVTEGCIMCALEDHETGCGEYQSIEALQWAQGFGYDLDPWQRWSIENILSVLPNGKWAAPDALIIVSRQNGKGTILEVRELAGLFVIGEELLIHTSHEFKTSVNHFNRLKATLAAYPALMRRVKRIAGSHGEESIELFPEPTLIFGSGGKQIRRKVASKLQFQARSRGSGRGFSCDCLVYDEGMILTDEQVGASMPTMSARANPQMIIAGSAGLKDSFQMAKSRKEMLRKAPRMFGAEWSANPHLEECPRDEINGRKSNYYVICDKHDDRDDPRTWAKANPAIGYRLTLDFTRRELFKMPENEFDRERNGVGEWPPDEEAWAVVSKEKWQALAVENPGYPVQPIAFAADIDEDGANATISAAWAWPVKGASARLTRTVIEIPQNCSRSGSDWVMAELQRLYKKWHPVGIGLPKTGPAAALIDDGKKLWGDRLIQIGAAEEAAAFAQLMQQVRAESICHFGQQGAPTLWHAMGRADVRVVGDGGKAWSRRDSTTDITPVTSSTISAYVLNKMFRSYDISKTIA
jgi:hypothetical protein